MIEIVWAGGRVYKVVLHTAVGLKLLGTFKSVQQAQRFVISARGY